MLPLSSHQFFATVIGIFSSFQEPVSPTVLQKCFDMQLQDVAQWSEKIPAVVKEKEETFGNYFSHGMIDILKIKMAYTFVSVNVTKFLS